MKKPHHQSTSPQKRILALDECVLAENEHHPDRESEKFDP